MVNGLGDGASWLMPTLKLFEQRCHKYLPLKSEAARHKVRTKRVPLIPFTRWETALLAP